jgi:CDP-6-deoxy-D-xylo-4-hexulose-3-dehydrase
MACTDDLEFAEMLRIVRANGWDRNLSALQQNKWRKRYAVESEFYDKYTFYDLGYNMRPTEITGFLGLYQLQFLDKNIEIRNKNYSYLEEFVIKNPDLIALKHDHIEKLSPFGFIVLCKTPKLKEKYLARFVKAHIEVRPMIAGNILRQPFYKKYVKELSYLPGAEFLHHNAFYCGNYPELSKDDLKVIGSCLKEG